MLTRSCDGALSGFVPRGSEEATNTKCWIKLVNGSCDGKCPKYGVKVSMAPTVKQGAELLRATENGTASEHHLSEESRSRTWPSQLPL